jgi:Transposase IS66 family
VEPHECGGQSHGGRCAGECGTAPVPFAAEYVRLTKQEHVPLKYEAEYWQSQHCRAVKRMEWQAEHDRRKLLRHKALAGITCGVIICDRYSAYKKFARLHPGVLLAFCWAHQRRDLLSAQDLQTIQGLLGQPPVLNRTDLSRRLCEQLNWRKPNDCLSSLRIHRFRGRDFVVGAGAVPSKGVGGRSRPRLTGHCVSTAHPSGSHPSRRSPCSRPPCPRPRYRWTSPRWNGWTSLGR